jgi:hypothetical protein
MIQQSEGSHLPEQNEHGLPSEEGGWGALGCAVNNVYSAGSLQRILEKRKTKIN